MKQERIIWLDWARAFAILSVILVHVSEGVFPFRLDGITAYPVAQETLLFSLFTLGRFGVPFFLFLTGYLLLPRNFTVERTVSFWKNRLLGLFFTTEIWIILLEIFWSRVFGTGWDFVSVLKKMCFLEPSSISHMWYMPMILGIYCFLPLISNALRSLNAKLLFFPLMVVFLFTSVFPSVGLFLQAHGGSALNSPVIDLEFGGGYFGLLLILGYIVYCGGFRRFPSWTLVLTVALLFGLAVFSQIWLYSAGFQYNIWYDFLPLIPASVCLFELFSRIKFPSSGLITYLSKASFGIYLVHSPIRILLIRHIPIADSYIKFTVVYVCTLLVSCLFVFVFSRIRFLKKVLFAS